MAQLPNLPLPGALKAPLRDALRGAAQMAGKADEALTPFKSALPDPVRTALREMVNSFEGGAKALLGPRITAQTIADAAAFLNGSAVNAATAAASAKVLAFAWDSRPETSGIMLSEALTGICLTTLGGETDHHAARVLLALRQAHVAGELPGLPVQPAPEALTQRDMHLAGLATWLLASRAETIEAETELLDLALALTAAYRTEILSAMDSLEDLSERLTTMAGHL